MTTRNIILFFLLLSIATSCKKAPTFQSIEIQLSDNWSFRKAGEKKWMPATVPGDVISDLYENHLIEDPFFGENEDSLRWIGDEDWEYQTTFDVPLDVLKNDRVMIHFSGLDTYADIYLNEKLVSGSDNMFRAYDVYCKELLKERRNILRVYFHSAVKTGMSKLKKLAYLLPSSEQVSKQEPTSAFTRKAQFQYGWDGGPRFITCGIWRPVSLRAWSNARIAEISLSPRKISQDTAMYDALFNIEASKPGTYTLACSVNDQPLGEPLTIHLKSGFNSEKVNFEITKPDIWWCNGMGSHYLYTFKAQLSFKNKLLTEQVKTFGVRKIELIQDSNANGRSFYFKLNGVPVFIKGASYIPPDVFTTRVTAEKYEKVITSATAANINMLRVWGGGIYENDLFYDLCDKNGILVWQDFMFATGMQPGDSAHVENIKQEAIENIKRLRNHPCLALWCGNSKNLVNWNYVGWKDRYTKDVATKIWNDYQKIFYQILPGAIKKYDPQTAYWASSPSSYDNQLPDRKSGDWHEWKVCYGVSPFSIYSERPARFVSEYGMQSFPSMKMLSSFSTKDSTDIPMSTLNFHQRLNIPWLSPPMSGNEVIMNYIQMYYNNPADLESFVYLSQIVQADALKAAIETHRINKPYCMGSLFWHLNDCWPGISWSTIDYNCNWKPAHYVLKKAFSNIIVVPTLTSGIIKVFTVSDTIAPIEAKLRLKLIDFDGNKIGSHSATVLLHPDTVQCVWNGNLEKICPQPLLNKSCLSVQFIAHDKILSENILYFTDPKYLDLPIPDISTKVQGTGNRFDIVLMADKFAKNVVLDTYEKEAFFSDNDFDLLPGKKKHLNVIYSGTSEELQNDIKITSLVNSY